MIVVVSALPVAIVLARRAGLVDRCHRGDRCFGDTRFGSRRKRGEYGAAGKAYVWAAVRRAR